MSVLLTLTIIWVVAVVLALAVFVIGTVLALGNARRHLKGVADDLERVAEQAVPLESTLSSLLAELQGVAGGLVRVDNALGKILDVVGGLVARK